MHAERRTRSRPPKQMHDRLPVHHVIKAHARWRIVPPLHTHTRTRKHTHTSTHTHTQSLFCQLLLVADAGLVLSILKREGGLLLLLLH